MALAALAMRFLRARICVCVCLLMPRKVGRQLS